MHRFTAVLANITVICPNLYVWLKYRDVSPNSQFLFNYSHNCLSCSRFKSSALSLSRIHRSHPTPPALRLIQWVEHILHSGGGAHLKPASLTLTWYQRYMLDLALLLSVGLLGPIVFCWIFCRNKASRDNHQKTE